MQISKAIIKQLAFENDIMATFMPKPFPGLAGNGLHIHEYLEDKDGNVLPDCFLLPEKSTALDFAYSLHTDLGEGFIRAIDVKTKMTVGKDHELKHRDVVEIISKK